MDFVMILLLLFLAAIGLFMGLVLLMNGVITKNQAKLAEAKASLVEQLGEGDYHIDIMPDLRCFGIAWDRQLVIVGGTAEATQDIGFRDPQTFRMNPVTIPFADIRGVDIEIDGVEVTTSRSTTSTNRGSQLVGGAIGAVALGPVGLLAGGLSGSSTTTGKAIGECKIKTVKLVVRVADRVSPLRTYSFYDVGYSEGYSASSSIMKPYIEKCAHFHALLTQIIEDRHTLTQVQQGENV